MLNLLGVTDWCARGFAIVAASHGIGTGRALQVTKLAGAFVGISIGLYTLLAAMLVSCSFDVPSGYHAQRDI